LKQSTAAWTCSSQVMAVSEASPGIHIGPYGAALMISGAMFSG
jgi:hypothetical protein